MNNKIDEVKLIEILPPNLREDPDIISASKSIDAEHQKTVSKINKVLTVGDIDNAEEKVVDHLALSAHADFYELSLPLEKKRKIAKNSYILHYTKGTPYAVEQLISDAFDNATVEEWFDYGGDPYYFRVQVEDRVTDREVLRKIIKAIDAVKNKRSWLEKIDIKRENRATLFINPFMQSNQNLTLKQIPLEDLYSSSNHLKVGGYNLQNHNIVLKQSPLDSEYSSSGGFYIGGYNLQNQNIVLKQLPLDSEYSSLGGFYVGTVNRQSNYLKIYTEV